MISSPQPPQANRSRVLLSFPDKALSLSHLNLPCNSLSPLQLLLPTVSKISLPSLCAAAFYILKTIGFEQLPSVYSAKSPKFLQSELLDHCLFPEILSRLSLIALHHFGSMGLKAGHSVPPEGQYRASQKAW